jgi:hypothetical protein
MKEHDKCRAYNKRRRHATPPAPVCPPLCLTVFGHYSESISTLTKSNWRDYALRLALFAVGRPSAASVIGAVDKPPTISHVLRPVFERGAPLQPLR